jgi:hypothetical protein
LKFRPPAGSNKGHSNGSGGGIGNGNGHVNDNNGSSDALEGAPAFCLRARALHVAVMQLTFGKTDSQVVRMCRERSMLRSELARCCGLDPYSSLDAWQTQTQAKFNGAFVNNFEVSAINRTVALWIGGSTLR